MSYLHANTKRRSRTRIRRLIFIITLLALAGILFGTASTLRHEEPPLPDPTPVVDPSTIPYIEQWGELTPAAKRNEYDETAFLAKYGRVTYSDGAYTALQGIDVSDHNGEIDWSAVKKDGIDFAIVRLGYRGYGNGAIVTDTRFAENVAALQSLGMPYGLYFFSQAISVDEAVEEANYVLQQLEGLSPTLPIYFDWEYVSETARTANMDLLVLTECALAFCKTIENAGFDAGIYFNQEFGYRHLNLITLQDYDLWLAEYATVPSFYYHFDQWQYSSHGTVAGIGTAVDLNLRFVPKEA